MLSLRVRCAVGGRADSPPLPNGTRCRIGNLTADVVATPPFAFLLELPDGLAAGEAFPGTDVEELRAAAELTRRDGLQAQLPSTCVSLIVVDGASGRVTITGSGRICRAYSYQLKDGTFTCSTSLRALRTAGVPLALDEDRVGEYLAYRYVCAPRTLCRGVRRLVAGERMILDLRESRVVEDRPPSFPVPSRSRIDPDAALTALAKDLGDDIGQVLGKATKPDILFSGGLDSSVVAVLAKEQAQRVSSSSSSFAFANTGDAEEEYARTAADHLGLEHEFHQCTNEEYLRGVVAAVDAAEEPVHHLQSVLLHLLFRQRAAQGTDAILTGEGADGLFGTDVHRKIRKYRLPLAVLRRAGLHGLARSASRWNLPGAERLEFFGLEFGPNLGSDRHVLWTLGQFGSLDVVRRITGQDCSTVQASRRLLMEPYVDLPLLQQITVLSMLGEGAATMHIWGRLAEGAGMALTSPFAAPRVVDLAMRLPWRWKEAEPKHAIRALLRRHGFPEAFLQRPKLGFGFPEGFWALPGALLQPFVDLAAKRYGRDTVQALQTERSDYAMVLWSLIGLDLWQRLVLEDEAPESLAGEIVDRHRTLTR